MFRPLRLALISGSTGALIAYKRREVSSFFDKPSSFFSSQKFDERFMNPPESDAVFFCSIGQHHTIATFHYYSRDAKFASKVWLRDIDGQVAEEREDESDPISDAVPFPGGAHDEPLQTALTYTDDGTPSPSLIPITKSSSFKHSQSVTFVDSMGLLDDQKRMVDFLKMIREAADSFHGDELVVNEGRKIKYMFSIPDLWYHHPHRTLFWDALRDAGYPIEKEDEIGIGDIEEFSSSSRSEFSDVTDARLSSRVEVYPGSYVTAVGYVNHSGNFPDEFRDDPCFTLLTDDGVVISGGLFACDMRSLYKTTMLKSTPWTASPVVMMMRQSVDVAKAAFGEKDKWTNFTEESKMLEYPLALDMLQKGQLLEVGPMVSNVSGSQYSMPREVVRSIIIDTITDPICTSLMHAMSGLPGAEKTVLHVDFLPQYGDLLEHVLHKVRIDQELSPYGFRCPDLGPSKAEDPNMTLGQRISRAKVQMDDKRSERIEELFSGSSDGIQVAQMRQFYSTHVRKLNYDPFKSDDEINTQENEHDNNGKLVVMKEKLEHVDTIPLQVVQVDDATRIAGMTYMGQYTLRALFARGLKRTVSATEGAIEILTRMQQLDDDADTDDIEDMSAEAGDVDTDGID